MLAARYQHRTSHDLDYWYNDTAAHRLIAAQDDYIWEMMVGREAKLDMNVTSLHSGCKGTISGVEFGLSPSNEGDWTDPGQKVHGRLITAQPSVMILAGKILKRWTMPGVAIPIRDLVDVTLQLASSRTLSKR